MYSNWSEYSHRKHEGERSLRRRDNNNDRWEGKVEAPIPRDSFQNYRGDGHSSTERGSRSREYIDSPGRQTSKDSSNRDWGRKSTVRRRVSSSPVWDAPEKRSRRYTEDDDDDGRYRRESLDQLPGDSFSHDHKSKDFKHAPPREDDFRYRKTPPDFRSRNWRDEFTQRRQQEDLSDRNVLKRFDGKRRRERPQERTCSPDHFTKIYVNRKRMDDPPSPVSHEDYYQDRTRAPVDISSREAFGSDSTPLNASVPERKFYKGFQRFLNVLNMGVNVDALNKIVSQPSTEVVSQSSFVNSVDHLWSPGSTERQRQLLASDEKLPRGTDGRDCLSQSPSVEKITLSPEDEEKRKQMQGVLQAIGVNLGLEELGQMTHRIQERLYGKKDGEEPRLSGQRGKKQEFSSRHRSRSPTSSRSSFSPTTPDCSIKQDSCSFSRSLTEVDQSQSQRSAEFSQMMSSSSFQSRGEIKSTSQTAQWNVPFTISTNPTPLTPPTPTYPPISCLPQLYPMPPAAPPPFFPPSGAQSLSPRFPPLLPHLPSPSNISPNIFAQIRHLLPPQNPFFSPLNVNSLQIQNKTQTSNPLRSNTPPRPRCLRVITGYQQGLNKSIQVLKKS
uniref:Uncharacterized protein n=1 Tax=Iconisemion striatum TaxID=60296 RepID=A0A1A7X005_9TELE